MFIVLLLSHLLMKVSGKFHGEAMMQKTAATVAARARVFGGTLPAHVTTFGGSSGDDPLVPSNLNRVNILSSPSFASPSDYDKHLPPKLSSLIAVSGYVVSSTGVPFPGVTVYYSWNNGLGSASATTDSTGMYVFPAVTPGSVQLSVSCSSSTSTLPMSCQFSSTVSLTTSVTDLTFTLPTFNQHTAIVQDENGNAVVGYWVNANSYNGDSQYAVCGATITSASITTQSFCGSASGGNQLKTDNNGQVTIALFADSSDSSYQGVFRAANTNNQLAGVVALSPPFLLNANTVTTMSVPNTIAISGNVYSSTGAPVPNLIANWGNTLGAFGYATTDSNGYFSFPAVGAGAMTVTMDNIYDGYQSDVPSCFNLAATFTTLVSSSSVVITLPPTITVTATIVNQDGTPVSGATVYGIQGGSSNSFSVCPSNPLISVPGGSTSSGCVSEVITSPYSTGCRSGMGTSDANGAVVLTFFQDPTDNMVVVIHADDNHAGRSGNSAVLHLNAATATAVVTMPPLLPIVSGYIKSAGSSGPVAVAGISVQIGSSSATTDNNGYYAIKNSVVPGSQTAIINLSNSGNGRAPASWNSGFWTNFDLETSTTSLNFTVPQFYTHTVVVVDQLGNPVPGAQVFPFNKNNGAWYIQVPFAQSMVPGATGCTPGTSSQFYVGDNGPINTITTNNNGVGHYSMFYIPGTTLLMGCQDPSNSARAAMTMLDLGSTGATNITFVLPSPPSPPQALTANSTSNVTAISWQPPAINGGYPLQNYTVSITPVTTSTGNRRLAIKLR